MMRKEIVNLLMWSQVTCHSVLLLHAASSKR